MLDEIIKNDKSYYMNTFGDRLPVCFEKGEGMYLFSDSGERYTDFFAGIAVNALGYAHPKYVAALCEQASKLLHTSSLYYIKSQALLAKKIVGLSCADKVFFANSGAEANEGAIKLAKMYFYKQGKTNKTEIITLTDSFHGRTLATLAATGQTKYQKPYKPLTPGFSHVPINDIDALEAAICENTAAVMVEFVQGESGVHPCDAEYAKALRALCDKKGVLLIADEVQSGIGRTGKMFAYENFGIEPDIFTLAKALGGGVPIGAVCAKEKFCAFEPGDHGSTFGGNPFCTQAACAVLDIIKEESLTENAAAMGKYFMQKLEELRLRFPDKIKEVRGMGLMIGVEFFAEKAKKVSASLFEKKILCGATLTTLRILPPLIIKEADIDYFCKELADTVEKLN